MSFSLTTLASDEFKKCFLDDLESLRLRAEELNCSPIYFTVGPDIIEYFIVWTVIKEIGLIKFKRYLQDNKIYLNKLLYDTKLDLYKKYEKKYGFIARCGEIKIFFDPDRSYIGLYAENLNKEEVNKKTGRGPVDFLCFKEEEVFKDFCFKKIQH